MPSRFPAPLSSIFFAAFVVFFPAERATAEWETLTGCRLLRNPANDGDSFHVEHRGKEYIFRLYFVDAPETSEQIPSRVEEQACIFGAPTERVIEAGEEAAAFTAQKLSRPFTVRTKWQDAEGRSHMPRRYALVETSDGKDLGELLAGAGYVRSFGAAAAPPGESESALRANYDRLADRAKASRRGAWGATRSDTLSIEPESEKTAGEDKELGDVSGMPSMDSLTETLRIEADPVVEMP